VGLDIKETTHVCGPFSPANAMSISYFFYNFLKERTIFNIEKENKQFVVCFLLLWKIRSPNFFNLKLSLSQKHLENTINTLINLSMATKKHLKKNQFETKIILVVRFTSSGKEKKKNT